MKYLIALLLFISCANEQETRSVDPIVFEPISYITLTNENTGGGSQRAYHLSGISEESLIFCFCQELCEREFIVVSALEFNEDTTNFRYKINLDDDFQTVSSSDWCTRYN